MKMKDINRPFYLIKSSDDDLTVDQRKWTLVVPGTKEQYKNYMTKFHCLLSPDQSLQANRASAVSGGVGMFPN